jgi:hypothetical protein
MREAVSDSQHFDMAFAVAPSAHLNAQRTHATFGMWRGQHRQARSQSIAPSRRNAHGHTHQVGKPVVQSHGVNEFGAVTVARTNGVRKPAEFTTATCRATQPITIVPTDRLTCKRAVMLLGAGRATRAVHRDVCFVNVVEAVGNESYDEAAQPWRSSGAYHQCLSTLPCNSVKVK